MPNKSIKNIFTNLWGLTAILLVILALYVNAGRILLPMVNTTTQGINEKLSQTLGLDVRVTEPSGGWSGLSPDFRLGSFVIKSVDGSGEDAIKTAGFFIKPDVVASLRERKIVFRKILVDQLELSFYQNDAGAWQIKGLPPVSNTANTKTDLDPLLNLLLYSSSLELTSVKLHLYYRNGKTASVLPTDMLIENRGYKHKLTTMVSLNDEKPSFNILVEAKGDPRQPAEFSVSAHARWSIFNTGKFFPLFGIETEDIDQYVPVDGEIWANWAANQGLDVQGKLSSPEVPLKPLGDSLESLYGLSLDFSVNYKPHDSWRVDLQDFAFNWYDTDWKTDQMRFQGTDKPGDVVEMRVDKLNLGNLWSILANVKTIPEALHNTLATLAPKGRLDNIRMTIPTTADTKEKFLLRANLVDVANSAWHGAPGSTGLTGYIETGIYRGFVDLDTVEFSLDFPPVYKMPLQFHKAVGQVAWDIDREKQKIFISSNTLKLTGDEGKVSAQFYLDIPTSQSPTNQGSHPEMYLAVGMRDVQANFRDKYIPYFLSPELLNWLSSSIRSGELAETGFIYRGALNRDVATYRTVQLRTDVKNGVLQFQRGWPLLSDVNAEVVIDDTHTNVAADTAKIFNSTLSNVQVVAEPYPILKSKSKNKNADGTKLTVKGMLEGNAHDGLRILRESPLRKNIGAALDYWSLSGKMAATLDLEIPLGASKEFTAKQNIDIRLADAVLNMPDLKLSFEKVSGLINFSDKTGLHADDLAANFWQRPVIVNISNPLVPSDTFTTEIVPSETAPSDLDSIESPSDKNEQREILIAMKGTSDINRVIDWSGIAMLQFLQGTFDYRAQLRIFADTKENKTRGHSELTIYSDLVGTEITLPAPLGKIAADQVPLHIEMPIGMEERNLHIRYGKQLDINLISRPEGLYSGHAVIGGKFAEPQVQPGLLISGFLPEFDFDPWRQALNRYQTYVGQGQEEDKSNFSLRLIELTTDLFRMGEFTLAEVNAKIQRQPDHWIVNAQSPIAAGELTFFDDQRPFRFAMDYIRLPGDEDEVAESELADAAKNSAEQTQAEDATDSTTIANEKNSPQQKQNDSADAIAIIENPLFNIQEHLANDPLRAIDPRQLPAIDFSTKEFSIGKIKFGQWSFQMRPHPNKMAFNNLFIELNDIRLHGSAENEGGNLEWIYSPEKGHQTRFSGQVSFKDLGGALQHFDYNPSVHSKEGNFVGELWWSGSPAVIDTRVLNGRIAVSLDKGYFSQIAGPSPAMRLLSVFNFATYARRLSLDFSDFTDKGLSYDTVKGVTDFYEGQVVIVEPIQLESISSEMRMSGNIDLINETLDTNVVFTLPFSQSLPWVAALTGAGLPVAAGVYVVTKIFKKQVEKISSASYSVNGGWDDPKVKLDKIFEDNNGNHAADN